MGLQSALTTALTGLQAAETTIDVIGNNVANSQTVGFKESDAVFATQFLQTISIGAAPSTNSGGTNPRQIGLGVKVAEISPNFTQGTIEISSNPLDVAIQGDGFLIVQSGTSRLYTRNGQLKLNAENEITTPTGQRLLGYGVNDDYEIQTDTLVPLTIPVGEERVAQQTSLANFSGVLNPSVDLGATPSISQSVVLGDGSVEQPVAADPAILGDNELLEAATPQAGLVTADTSSATLPGPGAAVVNYRFVYLDDNLTEPQEGNVSIERSIDNTDGAGEILLEDLPQQSGTAWTGIAIYRQDPASSDYFLVGNTTSTSFTDNVDDATLVTNQELDESIIDGGSYSYYITYYNSTEFIETRPSVRVGPVTLDEPGSKIRLDFSDLAPPNDVGFDQIRIYRNTSDDTSRFYRVDTDIDPIDISATSYVDNTPDSTILLQDEEINLDGPPSQNDTLLSDLVVRSGETYINDLFSEGTLTFRAEKDGVDIDPKTLDITATTTVLDLTTFIEDALGIDEESQTETPFPTAGNVELIDGQIRITSNLGEENAIEIPPAAFRFQAAGEVSSDSLDISFTETQVADGPGTSTELVVYDSLGLPLNVRITTVLEEKNSNTTVYRWYATSGSNEPLSPDQTTVVGDGRLVFDSNGDLINADQNQISVQRNTTASESPLGIELNFNQVKALGETDAQGNPISSLNFTSQDGFPPGVLTDFIITDDGLIQGQFSNGTQRAVGQLVMARFANNSGLQQVGDSLFNVGVNSGEPIFGAPGEEGIGTLTAGAVELSNTDIGQNLIELILASTQYRGGARVITATQELLDELLALQR